MLKNSNYSTDSFGFEIVKTQTQYVFEGKSYPIPNKTTLVNNKTMQPISVMGKNYRLFSNTDMENLANKISKTLSLPIDHFASHRGGKKVLVAFKRTDKKFKIGKWELSDHPVLYDYRDGNGKLSFGGAATLHRCQNMFKSTDVQLSIGHNSMLDEMVAEFEVALELYDFNVQAHLERLEKTTDIKMKMSDFKLIIGDLVQLDQDEIKKVANGTHEGIVSTRKANIVNGLIESWDEEKKDLGCNGFTAFNAVTHYYTHKRDKGLNDLVFGQFGSNESKSLNLVEAFA